MAESRDVGESVIRPGRIVRGGMPLPQQRPLPRMAMVSLVPYFLFAALIVLIADIVLLLRNRVRAANG